MHVNGHQEMYISCNKFNCKQYPPNKSPLIYLLCMCISNHRCHYVKTFIVYLCILQSNNQHSSFDHIGFIHHNKGNISRNISSKMDNIPHNIDNSQGSDNFNIICHNYTKNNRHTDTSINDEW